MLEIHPNKKDNSMATFQVTLSRTHKISERLKARATEFFKEAVSLGQIAREMGNSGDGQVQRLTEQGQTALVLSGKAERYSRVTAEVRAVIGRENETRGINALLARLDAVNRILAHKKEMLEHSKAVGLSLAELLAFKPLVSMDSRFSSGVQVKVLDADARVELEQSVTALQREAFQLADHIAEANAARLTLTLDDDIAAEVTGG